MYHNHKEIGRGERITQYAIELFDLVDITPDTKSEVDFVVTPRQMSMTPSVEAGIKAIRSITPPFKAGIERLEMKRALAQLSRVC